MMKQITIYQEAGRYAGWPANYGMWHWGDEIVVGFTVGYHQSDQRFHARDKSKPFVNMQARSLDGGQSWTVEPFNGNTPGNRGLSADEHMQPALQMGTALAQHDSTMPVTEPIDFTHPDFALMCARTGLQAGVRSLFYVSVDRCKSWSGPYAIPMFGQTGIAARTDYIVEDNHTCLLFLTANKSNGTEGKVFCARMQDGGQEIEYVAEVGGEPEGERDFNIMPSSLKLASGRILCAVRSRRVDDSGNDTNWIDLYASDDNAQTWTYLNRPVQFGGRNGNPPAFLQLPDDRLAIVYGNRDEPYRMAARLSDDDGVTWGDEIVLRDGHGNHDIGYPRAVALDDGTVVSAYYFNDEPDGNGDRFIEATLWTP